MIYLLVLFVFKFFKAFSIDVAQCCRQHNVPDICTNFLCNPEKPPDDFNIYDLFNSQNNCSVYMKDIGICLSQKRNHTGCCLNEAYDTDQNSCLGLCEGRGRSEKVRWSKYQSCLAVNLASMFRCFVKGYDSIPLPPQTIQINKIRSNSVELTWTPPDISELQYEITYDEETNGVNFDYAAFLDETSETNVELTDLYPGTKYFAYIVTVTADGAKRSLASEPVFFQTIGRAPIVRAFKTPIETPLDASSVVLSCRFEANGNSQTKIEWSQKIDDTHREVERSRVSINMYNSFYELREYVTTLEIENPKLSDLGMYRCKVSDQYGSGSAEIELREAVLSRANDEPPDTVLDCCHKKDVPRKCLIMCGNTITKSPKFNKNCSNEVSKIISCSIPRLDESQCCLKNRVPLACMHLCDSSIPESRFHSKICEDHLPSMEKCRFDGMIKRPSVVENLKAITNLENVETFLEWNPSDKAEVYHVYWKKIADDWKVRTTTATTIRIDQADEVRLVAANSYGISQSVELNL